MFQTSLLQLGKTDRADFIMGIYRPLNPDQLSACLEPLQECSEVLNHFSLCTLKMTETAEGLLTPLEADV